MLASICLFNLGSRWDHHQAGQHSTGGAHLDLGKERAAFGDRVSTRDRPLPDHSAWLLQWGGFEQDPSKIFFPEGQYDQRFYFSIIGAGYEGYRHVHYVLAFERKREGRIELVWRINLGYTDKVGSKRLLRKNAGTLEQFLARDGFFVQGRLSKTPLEQLNQVGGFAVYQFLSPPAGAGMRYWWVRPDGSTTETLVDLRESDSRIKYPLRSVPYAITPEEKAAVGLP